MRFLLVLVFLLGSHARAEEQPEEVRGALAHVMFAYFCSTNDDEISVQLAQRALNELNFQDVTALEAFEALEEQQPEVSEMSEAMGCSMVDRIEANHPFK